MGSTIAALLTCFNRREKTIACLRALHAQNLPEGVSVAVFLVDDGCTDGTGDAVRETFPVITVLQGSGSLFWSGGMRLAFGEAMKQGFDYYLWLNDDTHLYPDAIRKLLATNTALGPGETDRAIVVGSSCDPISGQLTYGGLERANNWHPLDFRQMLPGDLPQRCVTANGNCVLIPAAVAQEVGNMCPEYWHNLADMDYGLRAGRLGFSVWTTPGYMGSCANDHPARSRYRRLSIRERWIKVFGPTGHPPRAWAAYCRRHAGPLWFLFWCRPYVKDLILMYAPGGGLLDLKKTNRNNRRRVGFQPSTGQSVRTPSAAICEWRSDHKLAGPGIAGDPGRMGLAELSQDLNTEMALLSYESIQRKRVRQ